jgi:hypothetical protein
MSAENPLAMPIIDKHGNIVITLHQVLEQVVDNTTRIEDQAQPWPTKQFDSRNTILSSWMRRLASGKKQLSFTLSC